MKTNSELLKEFMNSEGKSRKMWKLLYTELLYNNSILTSDILKEINICLSNNFNFDLILDIIDFCLVYGEKEIIDRISDILDINTIYRFNTNKGPKTSKKTAIKIFYLMKKWADMLGNNFPKFKKLYDKISIKIKDYLSKVKKIDTYLKFLSEEDISDEKFIFEFYNQKQINNNQDDTVIMDLNLEESFINQSKNISQVDKKIENLKMSGQFKENINKVENKNNHFEDINLSKEKDNKKDFGSLVRDEIIKSNLQNNQSKNKGQNEDKSKNKEIKNEEGITDDGNIIRGRYNAGDNIDFNMGYNNKLIKNIDNNGSMCPNIEKESNFCLLKGKDYLNNLSNISKISSINNVNKEEIKLNKEENYVINMNSNIQPVKESKNIFSIKTKNENNINNNNPFTRNNNNNLKIFINFFQV